MKVLIACEFSGIVRDAFRKIGHDAWSCDLLPSEDNSKYHFQRDVKDLLAIHKCPGNLGGEGWKLQEPSEEWDLLIAHPPCTHTAVSGARWFKDKQKEQKAAIEFFMILINSSIDRIAVEHPISIMSTVYRKPDQIIQPWMFGHGETKATCLWLKNLPKLKPTKIVDGREGRVWKMSPGPDRWKERSRTLQGIADAMATQWGNDKLSDHDG